MRFRVWRMAFDTGRCASLSKDGRAGVYIRRGIAPPFCKSKIFVRTCSSLRIVTFSFYAFESGENKLFVGRFSFVFVKSFAEFAVEHIDVSA